MPQLKQGDIQGFTLESGDSITLTNCVVIGPSGPVTVTTSQTFGPYDKGAYLRVQANAGCTYDLVDSAWPLDAANLSPNQIKSLSASLPSDGSKFAVSEVTPYVQMTASGVAFTGACDFAGIEVISGSGTITIYDNTSAAGTIVMPATAVGVGKQERTWKLQLSLGCYVVISGTMTVNVLVG